MTSQSTVGTVLRATEERLRQQGIVSARAEAETFLTRLLEKSRAELFLNDQAAVSEDQLNRLASWLERRFTGEPLQYILGVAGFHHLELAVGPGVLVPRPETEILVEAVRKHLAKLPGRALRLLDLGTGSGNIALSLAKALPEITVIAVDRSPQALKIARENCERAGLTERVQMVQGDLYEAAPCEPGSFDCIVSNPPYIATSEIDTLPREVRDFEPRTALDGGSDGLGVIRAVIEQAPKYLRAGGWLFLEIGAGQAEAIARLFTSSGGWEPAAFEKDLCGVTRVVKARLREREPR